MSYLPADEPDCSATPGRVRLTIEPKDRDLGEFSVRRVLPSAECRSVGPFVFFDHFGPAEFPPGKGINVRPHPHIGLATLSYLFEGEILHRDSLGFVQPIHPGAVNLMTAGRGIVHSERAGKDLDRDSRLHGLQVWMALPDEAEECEPAFEHVPADRLPSVDVDGVRVRVVCGEAHGAASPVALKIPTLYIDYQLPAGSEIELPGADELAIYVAEGRLRCGDATIEAGTMAVFDLSEGAPSVAAEEDSRAVAVGGRSPGRRHVWWNFVSSSRERIEQAKADWREGRFALIPGDSEESIPLPE